MRWLVEYRRVLRLWSGRRRWWGSLRLLVLLAIVSLFALTGFAIVSWATAGDGPGRIDGGCSNNQFGCGTLIEISATVLTVGFASGVFIFWRVSRIVGAHVRDWRTKPHRLVPTATPIDHVVGRNGICEILEEDLADPKPRPQIVVGGVGEGKTAVLVRLAQRLVERGAVPVAVRLRDAKRSLDFEALASSSFTTRVEGPLISADEGDKVWRKLRKDRHIVVLADGLEEALLESEARATEIRDALEKAEAARLPLVVTSRPDESLVDIDAAVIRLEPLSARAAIAYIADERDRDGPPGAELDDVRALADTADIADRPLFLALMRESYRTARDGVRGVEDLPKDGSRVDVQVKLLDQWKERLLSDANKRRSWPGDRQEVLNGIESMACVALAENTLELDFDDFDKSPYRPRRAENGMNARKVAREAARMQVVEMTQKGMRFKHSIMQAYLGAQDLPDWVGGYRDRVRARIVEQLRRAQRVTGPDYLADALTNPSREVLMALVVCCNLHGDAAMSASLRGRLLRLATGSDLAHDPIAFDVLAAAAEIDAMIGGAGSRRVASAAVELWQDADAALLSGELRDAKVRAILGMARSGRPAAYDAIWQICCCERDYRVRFRAAEELAGGGDDAFQAMQPGQLLTECGSALTYHDDPSGFTAPQVRQACVQAWALPLLARHCASTADLALEALEGWIELTKPNAEDGPGLHLGVEASLAQGFRLEANRIPRPGEDPGGRDRLIALATELMASARWWHTRLALVQAFGLWALGAAGERRRKLEDQITQCVARDRHPFVKAAAELSRDAVNADGNTRRLRRGERRPARRGLCGPARYVWIDEVGVSGKVGPRRTPPDPNSPTGRWISRDAGWRSLAPRARLLVADVLVMLNLVEGEAPPADNEERRNGGSPHPGADERVREREKRRMRAMGDELPHCVAHPMKRHCLRVMESGGHGAGGDTDYSTACDCGLCPYPGFGTVPFRGELSETFCREQARLLSGHWKDFPRGHWSRQGGARRVGRRARMRPGWGPDRPWLRRGKARSHLKAFWAQMEQRDRG